MNPPKMPIHIGDLLRDTGHLRALLIGAYLLLLFHHWSTGELPDDDDQLSAIARMSPAEWRKARPILIKFFDDQGGAMGVSRKIWRARSRVTRREQRRARKVAKLKQSQAKL
jgi:uncharacterized protein YdaU (DUF1376 family)